MVKDLPETEENKNEKIIYLNDLDDLDLTTDEVNVLTMVYNASEEVSVFTDEENYGLIGLDFAIKVLNEIDPENFSKHGQKIRLDLISELNLFIEPDVELLESEIISYQDLIGKIQSDMAELSGDDLAEFAEHLGINVTYQGDSMFKLTEK